MSSSTGRPSSPTTSMANLSPSAKDRSASSAEKREARWIRMAEKIEILGSSDPVCCPLVR